MPRDYQQLAVVTVTESNISMTAQPQRNGGGISDRQLAPVFYARIGRAGQVAKIISLQGHALGSSAARCPLLSTA